ncbi:hypothetical protein [Metabacillus endolithicus]|uniref:hypothetical protein n=1 Tax=Metabacillus endolithicus TaxID=1535204 RepID=UPI001FF78BE9|nr:hypothetical protein [Metabacillus endolithicus]UPG65524.1 hypothetical protein MVE64_11445 [Metabacillus endolithicus]
MKSKLLIIILAYHLQKRGLIDYESIDYSRVPLTEVGTIDFEKLGVIDNPYVVEIMEEAFESYVFENEKKEREAKGLIETFEFPVDENGEHYYVSYDGKIIKGKANYAKQYVLPQTDEEWDAALAETDGYRIISPEDQQKEYDELQRIKSLEYIKDEISYIDDYNKLSYFYKEILRRITSTNEPIYSIELEDNEIIITLLDKNSVVHSFNGVIFNKLYTWSGNILSDFDKLSRLTFKAKNDESLKLSVTMQEFLEFAGMETIHGQYVHMDGDSFPPYHWYVNDLKKFDEFEKKFSK